MTKTEIVLESGGWAIGATPEYLAVRRGTLEVARLTACPLIDGRPGVPSPGRLSR